MLMMKRVQFRLAACTVLLGIATVLASDGPALAQERFELTSIKAVRPTLVNTVNALERRDVKAARKAFDSYDSAWNGVEMYINVRNREMYDVIEHGFQARINKGLEAPGADTESLLAEAKAMLAKFDEAVNMIERSPPLNPRFDDVARLRMVRAHLREVLPALQLEDFENARKSFAAFEMNWPSIQDLIKARSTQSHAEIQKAIVEVSQALLSEKPDADTLVAQVNELMTRYNAPLADITKEARTRQ
jgi:hypothetical protein